MKDENLGVRAPTHTEAAAETSVAVSEGLSMQRKMDLVVRLLRGEPLYLVSRDSHVPPCELEEWRREFLGTGRSKHFVP